MAAQDLEGRRVVPLGSAVRRRALLVGNDHYISLRELHNGIRDARAMATALRECGFDVTVLTDASAGALRDGVGGFINGVKPGDVALFYYSGHAVQINGENYLSPVDLAASNDSQAAARSSLRMSETLEQMAARGAAIQIVILDACRNNPFVQERSIESADGLATMSASRGTFIAYATAPGRTADDNAAGVNGLYTSYLIEALREPGLTIEEVFKRVGAHVQQASNGNQVPWTSQSLEGDFYFRLRDGLTPSQTVSTSRQGIPGETKANPRDGQRYVWIPAGGFQMGCSARDDECDADETPAHQVTIAKGFWLGQTEVTVGAWKRYRAAARKPSLPTSDGGGRTNFNEASGDDNMPVVFVTWEEARDFCEWTGGRLPTEAEWEYGARANTTSNRYSDLKVAAWYADNSGTRPVDSASIWGASQAEYGKRLYENGNGPHRVARLQPNQWNLYDMLGNVWEWTADWYVEKSYMQGITREPLDAIRENRRALRGGSWYFYPSAVRVSVRGWDSPLNRSHDTGFRCAE